MMSELGRETVSGVCSSQRWFENVNKKYCFQNMVNTIFNVTDLDRAISMLKGTEMEPAIATMTFLCQSFYIWGFQPPQRLSSEDSSWCTHDTKLRSRPAARIPPRRVLLLQQALLSGRNSLGITKNNDDIPDLQARLGAPARLHEFPGDDRTDLATKTFHIKLRQCLPYPCRAGCEPYRMKPG